MDSHIAEPISVKLSGVDKGCAESNLSQKKFEKTSLKKKLWFLFALAPLLFLISACVTTHSALRTVALRHIYLIE